jgi:SAM-dependent methyltransferase
MSSIDFHLKIVDLEGSQTLMTKMYLNFLMLSSLCWIPFFTAEAAPGDKERWDKKYETEQYISGKEPIAFLRENLSLLPQGKALDIAMGEGRDGVYLATQGFMVTGLDISAVGLKKAEALARARGTQIETKVVDLETYQLPAERYDVIICSYYLQRNLFPQIVHSLKPGGMAIVETYTHDHLKYRPTFTPQYLLDRNELLVHFKDLTILRYQVVDTGQAVYASILVQKP